MYGAQKLFIFNMVNVCSECVVAGHSTWGWMSAAVISITEVLQASTCSWSSGGSWMLAVCTHCSQQSCNERAQSAVASGHFVSLTMNVFSALDNKWYLQTSLEHVVYFCNCKVSKNARMDFSVLVGVEVVHVSGQCWGIWWLSESYVLVCVPQCKLCCHQFGVNSWNNVEEDCLCWITNCPVFCWVDIINQCELLRLCRWV